MEKDNKQQDEVEDGEEARKFIVYFPLILKNFHFTTFRQRIRDEGKF